MHEDGFALSRITVALLRPVPIARLVVEVDPARGRTVRRTSARLWAGDQLVAEAQGIAIRRAPVEPSPTPAPGPWPAPEGIEPFVFPFFSNPVGYHTAVDLRCAMGAWGRTPVGFWMRPRFPLVQGEPTGAIERTVLLADAQSGMGPPQDPLRFTFLNPDLTVYFERAPVGDWLGFDIRSGNGPDGAGLVHSAIRDARGAVGVSAQSMVVAARAP